MILPPLAAFETWASTYDDAPNPLLALEERILRPRLNLTAGMRVLDLATGTGRWLQYAASCGTNAVGIDLSSGMLRRAAAKPGLSGRIAQADLCALPLANQCADLAIVSFSLSYIRNASAVFQECARVARRIVVSDMHFDAIAAGWTRSFRCGQRPFQIESFRHTLTQVMDAGNSAQLKLTWCAGAYFSEAEYPLFERAGCGEAFARVSPIPAVWIGEWSRA